MADLTPVVYAPDSVLIAQTRKKPVDFIPNRSYGLKKLKARIAMKDRAKVRTR